MSLEQTFTAAREIAEELATGNDLVSVYDQDEEGFFFFAGDGGWWVYIEPRRRRRYIIACAVDQDGEPYDEEEIWTEDLEELREILTDHVAEAMEGEEEE
jgi:hypothetical protein